jgi:hypothetical protein
LALRQLLTRGAAATDIIGRSAMPLQPQAGRRQRGTPMAYNRSQARKLLTGTEFDLFESSLADAAKAPTAAQLRAKLARARRLRDKYRDLYQRQRVSLRAAMGTKSGRSEVANARTQAKAVLFGEVLARLQKQLDRKEAADKRAATRPTAAHKLAARATATARPALGRSPKAPARAAPKSLLPASRQATAGIPAAARRGNPLLNPRNKAISAHVRAQGRRSQARRDRR